MGAVNSCCIPRRSDNDCRENHTSTPRFKGHRRNLSATFNMALIEDLDQTTNQVNINTATEEQLMTLPGINRQTSTKIIEYRRKIGGFKKVEDLALVSGVGATKLAQIRQEICVTSKKPLGGSSGSSPDGSKMDLSRTSKEPQKLNGIPFVKVNVNTGNVFQLMKVKGIGQVLAENIVTYRDKKGPFKSLDDLVKVKGIGPVLLSAIRHYLSLDNAEVEGLAPPPPPQTNGQIPNAITNNSGLKPPSSISEKSMENLLEVIGPFKTKATRPSVTPFLFKRENKHAVRIASWNIERCSTEKANNHGVRDVICMTILENGLSLVAFQELADQDALKQICEELNNPSLPNVKKWAGHRGVWEYTVSDAAGKMYQSNEYNGFLYDTSQGIKLVSCSLLDKPTNWKNKQFVRRPFIGTFKMKRFDCVMVSVHLKATGLDNEDLSKLQAEIDKIPDLVEAIEHYFLGEKDIILLGDFNLAPDQGDFDPLKERGFKNVIEAGTFTNISNSNPTGSQTYDNLWITKETQKVYTGYSGVVREGLSSPWIPKGWDWGGVVSDHCPVWAEFFTYRDYDKADLSIGTEAIRFTVGADS